MKMHGIILSVFWVCKQNGRETDGAGFHALPEEDTLFLNETQVEEFIDRPYYILENGRKTEVSVTGIC